MIAHFAVIPGGREPPSSFAVEVPFVAKCSLNNVRKYSVPEELPQPACTDADLSNALEFILSMT